MGELFHFMEARFHKLFPLLLGIQHHKNFKENITYV